MSDTLREELITSEAAERMLTRVTPIYDNSVVALYCFEAMGKEFDAVAQILDELPAQLNPDTATWLLPLWERRYGLITDTTLSLDERRRKIRLRKKHTGAFNPYKLQQLAENLTGISARVVEHVSAYTFAVYLSAMTTSEEELRKAVRKMKPSHRTFLIRYEQYVPGEIRTGGFIAQYRHFDLAQTN